MSAADLAIIAVMYVLTALGITVGFHRLLTHRSFQTSKPLEYTFAVLGSMAVQGPVISWVADHRKHHAHTDEEGDPHSPHVGHGEGVRGVFAGLWHAHTGWLLTEQGRADWKRYARDLVRGPRDAVHQPPLRLRSSSLSLAIPAARSAIAVTGTLAGGADRAALGRPGPRSSSSTTSPGASTPSATSSAAAASTSTTSRRNVFWLALPSLGEAWHHNHHAFPRSAAARPEALGARPLGAGDRRAGAARPGLERGPDLARAPGGQDRRGLARVPPVCSRIARTMVSQSARSTPWPAPSRGSSVAPGISSASASPCPSGNIGSAVPWITSVGRVIEDSGWRDRSSSGMHVVVLQRPRSRAPARRRAGRGRGRPPHRSGRWPPASTRE